MAAVEQEQGNVLEAAEPSQRFNGGHRTLGAPVAQFLYKNAGGEPLMWVCRYRAKDPDTPTLDDSGLLTRWYTREEMKWVEHRGSPPGAPLYQMDRIFRSPASPVYLLDSEEAAEALQAIMEGGGSNAICSTWPGGPPAIKRAPWANLVERDVTLWPTQQQQSIMAMLTIAAKLHPITHESGHELFMVRVPSDKPPGWNVALARERGWNFEHIQDFLMQHADVVGDVPRLPTTRLMPAPAVEPEKRIGAGGSVLLKWKEMHLACNTSGQPFANMHNVVQVVKHNRGAYCDVWLDEFHNRIMTRETDSKDANEWTEAHTLEFCQWIQDPDGGNIAKITPKVVHDGVVLAASRNRRNEVREWLHTLKWDGSERLERALVCGWGVYDNEYHAAVGRCFLMGAVARIMRPGCQVDNMPVFEGPEEAKKTTALMTLASERWFDNPSYRLGDHDFYQCLPGKWILEFAEMANLSGRTGDLLKSVITRRSDTYRPSYGRVSVTFPRMCVFSATTNRDDWNTSDTGARRFWPVVVGQIDVAWIEREREQLFAEAVARFERGEPWWNVSRELARAQQDARAPYDMWDGLIAEYLASVTDATVESVALRALEIQDRSKWGPAVQGRITAGFRKAGWIPSRVQVHGKQVRGWIAPTETPSAPAPGDPPPEW